jgi:hypothetical protein
MYSDVWVGAIGWKVDDLDDVCSDRIDTCQSGAWIAGNALNHRFGSTCEMAGCRSEEGLIDLNSSQPWGNLCPAKYNQ